MSDVSKTNDLIAEKLREAAKRADWYQTGEAKLLDAAADALEARQPSEDGKYIFRLIETIKQTGGSVEIHGVKIMPCDEFGRTAAVPDAATEDMTVAEFCEALGFVDDSTTPAKLRDIVEPIQWWDSEARDHVECARICEQCGETLARTLCGECHGGGQRDGGNGTVRECGNCGGAGWLHEGCAEVSYADLVAERDAALAAIERVQETLSLHNPNGRLVKEVLAALDGVPEPDDDPCKAETHSWSHYRPEQIDSYWIRCTRLGKHDEHEDSNTGLNWRSRSPVEGESE